MKWLLKRTLTACLLMGVFCSAVVVVGRLDYTPSKLKALGIDMCDGEPCFHGIKAGMDWATVQKLFPHGTMEPKYYGVDSVEGLPPIRFFPSSDRTTVSRIWIVTDMGTPSFSFTAKDVIADYGIPCRVYLLNTARYTSMSVFYPKLEVIFGDGVNTTGIHTNSLQWTSPVWEVIISDQSQISCTTSTESYIGRWHGFSDAEDYVRRNLKDMRIAQNTSVKP